MVGAARLCGGPLCDQTFHVILPVRKWGFVTPEAKRLSITRDEGNAFFQGADGPMYM